MKIYEYWVSRIRPNWKMTIIDRFGLIDPKYEQIPFPKHTDKDFIELIEERAKELGEKTIAWSGGLDSTMLASVYLKLGIPFKIIHTQDSINNCPLFYEYLKSKDIEMIPKEKIADFKEPNILSGWLSDLLFYCEFQRYKQKDLRRTNGEKRLIVPEECLTDIHKLAEEKFGLDLKTEFDYFRFVTYCFSYTACLYDLQLESQNPTIISFFDRPQFTDYAFTHFYENPILYPGKQIYRDYICEVTGDIRYQSNEHIYRRGTPFRWIYSMENLNIVKECGLYCGEYKRIVD